MEHPVIIARFGKTFGVKGWVRVQSFMDFEHKITDYQPWHIHKQNADIWAAIDVIDSQFQADKLVVQVKGINTLEQAKALLTGKEIAVARGQLPALEKGDFYRLDIEGLEIITTQGESLGHVDYLMESGANDVLVVKGERERLIPYIKERVIKKVDLDNQNIIVDWDPDF